MKKLFLASLLALLSISANASDFEVNGIFYNITGDNTVEVAQNGQYTGDIVIPNSVTYDSKEYNVIGIGERAFQWCTSMTSISIPASVTYIGDWAFFYNDNLKSITVASDNKVYDSRDNCNAIIRTADGCLIKGCPNTVIPDGVISIAKRALAYGYAMQKSVNIPASVVDIDDAAFTDCVGLKSITVASDNKVYDSRNNCNAIIRTADNCLIKGCQSTVIPDGVTSIAKDAFSGIYLWSINIPASVTSIADRAFYYCFYIGPITVASDNKVYDSRNNCNAIIRTADNSLILGCQSTVIPDGVTSIAKEAFLNCTDLKSINIPKSVTSIRENAFYNCYNLKSIDIPESVTNIEGWAFQSCSGLKSVNISAGITSIENGTFSGCANLTSINIPANVTSIGWSAFRGCYRLTSINIPQNVTSIGEWAFGDCESLGDIYCYGSVPAEIIYETFTENIYNACTLHVPYGTTEAYKATEWRNFFNIVEFDPTGVEAVSSGDKVAKEIQIYNLGGVRMAAPQRGLNIINGKKYLNAF